VGRERAVPLGGLQHVGVRVVPLDDGERIADERGLVLCLEGGGGEEIEGGVDAVGAAGTGGAGVAMGDAADILRLHAKPECLRQVALVYATVQQAHAVVDEVAGHEHAQAEREHLKPVNAATTAAAI